ncbi:peptide ABC transporter permease [Amedibacterium intestinale]|uniref:ABC transporter permease n=1 Tax=Amedibacterium intestinale TaxID=2583452 RepID=UPI00137461CD|nr:ABC transporter permease [Amedibacterium intestinale]BBK62487.1 peptide ABC transporter permease [Amedibacterium intestinale]
MLKYILKRLVNLIPVVFIISILVFATVQAMPGDPVDAYLGMNFKVTEQQREQLREELGLNKSQPEQYVRWVGRMVTGDLGDSIKLKKPVAEVIGSYVWNTFYLNALSLIVALLFAIPIGIKQAVKKGSKYDNFWTVFSLIGVSVPTFFFALLLLFFVALNIPNFPLNGMKDATMDAFGYPNKFVEILDILKHSILPVIVLAFSTFATFSRYVRNSMIEVINMDYIRTARSKGLKEKVVIYKHAFRNAMIPLVTLLGMYIPTLFSGAVILETVFIWPGIGKVLIDAINARDNSLVTACLMFSALLMVLGNLLADIFYSMVDPRIKVDN